MYFVLYLSKDLKIEVFRAKGLAQIFCNDVRRVWLGKGHSCSYRVIGMSKARHRIDVVGQARHRSIVKHQKLYIRKKYR